MHASNDFAVIRSVTRDGAPPIPADAHLSPICHDFLQRCLANDAVKRASAADLLLDGFVCQVLPDSSNLEHSVSVPLDGTIQPKALIKYKHPLLSAAASVPPEHQSGNMRAKAKEWPISGASGQDGVIKGGSSPNPQITRQLSSDNSTPTPASASRYWQV